uniref:Leucine-rich repeat protein 1 n=1 Tax=Rhabditophanes sp. KR3021 TaxID=114890 RepID=A0AC35TFS2_9BILA
MECKVCIVRDIGMDRIRLRHGSVRIDKEGDDYSDLGLIVEYGNYRKRFNLNNNIRSIRKAGERDMTTISIINPMTIICISSPHQYQIENFITNISCIKNGNFNEMHEYRLVNVNKMPMRREISTTKDWQGFIPSIYLTTLVIYQTPFDATFIKIGTAMNLKTLIMDEVLPRSGEFYFPNSFLFCLSRMNGLTHYELKNNTLTTGCRLSADFCDKLMEVLSEQISVLSLFNNNLTRMPKGIGRLVRLRDFDFSDNLCITVPGELAKLKVLDKLKLASLVPMIFLPASLFKGPFHINELYLRTFQSMADIEASDSHVLRTYLERCECVDLIDIHAEGLAKPPTLLEICGKVMNGNGLANNLPSHLDDWLESFVECDVCGIAIPDSYHRCSFMTSRLGVLATTIYGNHNYINTPIAVLIKTCKCCAKASLIRKTIHNVYGEIVNNFEVPQN